MLKGTLVCNATAECSQSGFCIINFSLIRLIFGTPVLAFRGSDIECSHFGLSTVHTFEPNISLIRLILIMQNPKWLVSVVHKV